jgi:hypothetical protein
MSNHSAARVRRIPVGAEPLIGNDRYDYADAFEVRLGQPDARSAEQFARCAVEEAASPVRWTIRAAHRHLLRLRLGPDASPDHLFGWRIRTSQPDVVHLEAVSPLLGRGALVFRRPDPARAVINTYLFFTRPAPARAVWKIVGPVHRMVTPYLLKRAAATGTRGRVIDQIAPDFKLLDVWALPVEGRRDEFASFLEMMASLDPGKAESGASRALFSLRLRLGHWFGWDDHAAPRPIPGCTETTLSARLPDELRGTATSPAISGATQRAAGFIPLYRTDDEWAAELSNATVHGVLHVAWVEQGGGRYRAQMGVYVKPRGRLGEAYMLLIQPFRHLVVYPALMRQIGRAWDARSSRRSRG